MWEVVYASFWFWCIIAPAAWIAFHLYMWIIKCLFPNSMKPHDHLHPTTPQKSSNADQGERRAGG
jgi:hypothetical protein